MLINFSSPTVMQPARLVGWKELAHASGATATVDLGAAADGKPAGEYLALPAPTNLDAYLPLQGKPVDQPLLLPAPQATVPAPTMPSQPPAGQPAHELAADINGDQVITYEFLPDGTIAEKAPTGSSPSALSTGWLGYARELFIPRNSQSSVSADYIPTRKCMFIHDIAFSLGKFASGAAVAAALGANPIWGGAAMATFNLIVDRTCQTAGFLSTFATPQADRNPRPWILAGETLDTAGTIVQSAAAMIPFAVLPINLAAAVVSVFGGGMRGAAQANIDPRQAVADNLGELRAKNGNQAFVASLVGSLGGMAAFRALTPILGNLAAPAITGVAAGVAVLSMAAMLRRLDFHPINEKAVRSVVEQQEQGNPVPAPEKEKVFRSVLTIGARDRIVLGREIRELVADRKHFDELRSMYRGRNYLLDVKQGESYIVLRNECSLHDRFQAVMQAVHVEHLKAGDAYAQRVEKDGLEAADRWLASESLSRTPASVEPLVAEMKAAGWSVDKMRFLDSGKRARWEDAPAAGSNPVGGQSFATQPEVRG